MSIGRCSMTKDDKFQVKVPEFWDEIKDEPISIRKESENNGNKFWSFKIYIKKYIAIAVALAVIITSVFTVYKLNNGGKEKISNVALESPLDLDNKEANLSFNEKLGKIPKASSIESTGNECLAYFSLFYNGIHYKTPYWWNSQYNSLDDYGKIVAINDLLGEELTKTRYSLGDRFIGENEKDYWKVDGAANLAVGTSIYEVNGYDSKDIVMCLVESDSDVPNIMFFCRDNFEEIPQDKYILDEDNYINNIKMAYQVGAFDNKKRISEDIDISVIDSIFQDIKGKEKVNVEDHYELWKETDEVKNAIDGMRSIRIITKNDIAINLEITNSGYLEIYNTWSVYKLDDEVWEAVWEKLSLKKIRDYMDSEGYNYMDGVYVPKSAPLDSPKLQEYLNP